MNTLRYCALIALATTSFAFAQEKPERRPSAPPPEKIEPRTTPVSDDELLTEEETYRDSEQIYRKFTYYVAKNRTKVKHGSYVEYYSNGTKKRELTYVHGNPHGRQRWWHNNGRTWMDFSCDMGKRHGTYQEYHRTGKKRKTVVYDQGKVVKRK